MNVTVIHGSPRKKGNSHQIVRELCEELEKKGASISQHEMQGLSVQGCLGCMACKTKTERCVIKDDLTPVYEEVHNADVLVMASPVYFGDISSQLKPFMDRLYHLFTPDFHESHEEAEGVDRGRVTRLKEGTKLVFITTQGSPSSVDFADIQTRYGKFFRWLGFDEVHCLRGLGDPDVHENHNMEQVLEQAKALGAAL